MAFKFTLEQVLKYRTQMEEQAKIELARVERERQREQARVDELEATILQQQIAHDALNVMQSGERWLLDNYIKALKSDVAVARQRVFNWSKAVDAARAVLLQRATEKKVLEKLKSAQAENYAKEEKYREQKEFDETASIRFKASY